MAVPPVTAPGAVRPPSPVVELVVLVDGAALARAGLLRTERELLEGRRRRLAHEAHLFPDDEWVPPLVAANGAELLGDTVWPEGLRDRPPLAVLEAEVKPPGLEEAAVRCHHAADALAPLLVF